MAFSKTPTMDTYSSQRIPVAWDLVLQAVSTSTDYPLLSGMTNMVPYKVPDSEGDLYAETRYGFAADQVVAGSNYVCRGMYVWEKTPGTIYYYCVVVNTATGICYVYTSTNGTTWSTVVNWSQTSTYPARFTEYITSTNTKYLILVTGTKGYRFTDNTSPTEITDADFPTPHVPWPVVLDGYLFLAKSETGDIYNSDLDDPTAWTAGSFISSELYPDDIRALVKIDNYLLAIGAQGSEYFYDAANATGTPLARVEGASLPFGTTFPNSIASSFDKVTFFANTNDGGYSMVSISGMKYELIPAEAMVHILTNQTFNGVITQTGVRGYYLRMQGELFYILNSKGNENDTDPEDYVYCYSFKNKRWCLFNLAGAARFPVFFSISGTTLKPLTYVAGHTTTGVFLGTMSAGYPNDVLPEGPFSIVQEAIIPPQAFGTLNRKTMSRLGVFYTTYDAVIALTLSYSDDGNVTFSTGRNPIHTVQGGAPFITQLGEFRYRGFKIYNPANNIQLYYLEADINKGMR
jgi:hypothetical protein